MARSTAQHRCGHARHVVKLSNNLGLAPESQAGGVGSEKRWIDFKYTANADAESTCNKCHSLGRVISQRQPGRMGSARGDAPRLTTR